MLEQLNYEVSNMQLMYADPNLLTTSYDLKKITIVCTIACTISCDK